VNAGFPSWWSLRSGPSGARALQRDPDSKSATERPGLRCRPSRRKRRNPRNCRRFVSALGGTRTPNLLIRRATAADPASHGGCRRVPESQASRTPPWTNRHRTAPPVPGRSDTSLIHVARRIWARAEGCGVPRDADPEHGLVSR
jgi:hypothetical protein